MQFVDLSAPIAPSSPEAPPFQRIAVVRHNHAAGAAQAEALFGVPPSLLRDGEGWAVEEIAFMTHNVTHLDAPWHYNSRIQGRPAATIDTLPLEWFFQEGVVLDFRHKADGDAVTAAEVEAELGRIAAPLEPLTIVLVRTGRDAGYGERDYPARGCGVSAAATRWLFDRGIRVMGIDAWSWDSPLDGQTREALARREPGVFWAAHQSDLPYAQIERLINLGALPPSGFKVACFPLRIEKGSAGPARVVAMLDD